MKKWIIEKNRFIMSASVDIHLELVHNSDKVKGGGAWEIDDKQKLLVLYGMSIDYGHCDIKLFNKDLDAIQLIFFVENGYKIYFSEEDKLENILKEGKWSIDDFVDITEKINC